MPFIEPSVGSLHELADEGDLQLNARSARRETGAPIELKRSIFEEIPAVVVGLISDQRLTVEGDHDEVIMVWDLDGGPAGVQVRGDGLQGLQEVRFPGRVVVLGLTIQGGASQGSQLVEEVFGVARARESSGISSHRPPGPGQELIMIFPGRW